jgi:tetratricopeptide (TPR) repeat protein
VKFKTARRLLKLTTFLFILVFCAEVLHAQQAEIRYADQLFRQGEHEQAFQLYAELLRRNPDNLAVVDRKSAAYISLKQYDDAIRVLENYMKRNPDQINLGIRIGEAWHMAGEREKAIEAWHELTRLNARNAQAYRIVAEAMSNRREYDAASYMLMEARELMGNRQLFAFDIARNFTASGAYEKAMQEYSQLLISNSGFLVTIQRQIARFDDPYFRDVAIMEFEEISRNLAPDSEEWVAHRRMLIWLYMERNLYRRAVVTARNLEDRLTDLSYPLYEIARTLMNLNEFELAANAFERYTSNEMHPLFAESREQKALMFISRARYLIDNNLDFGTEAASMYEQAYALLSELEQVKTSYENRPNVLVLLTEISLDYLKDAERARKWHEQVAQLRGRVANQALADYLAGRIYMFEQDFVRARIALTRANRAARTGELAEKSRYFLSLNDFYAGDFEFSKLQMRSLRRQHTSYYANNALKLNSWLQEGMIQDSASVELKQFSEAMFHHNSGDDVKALEILRPFFMPVDAPLKSHALILAGNLFRKHDPQTGYALMNRFIESGLPSSMKEQILWTRARLSDAIFHLSAEGLPESGLPKELVESYHIYTGQHQSPIQTPDIATVISHYEDIILEFPQGFYGSEVRTRIRKLIQTASLP